MFADGFDHLPGAGEAGGESHQVAGSYLDGFPMAVVDKDFAGQKVASFIFRVGPWEGGDFLAPNRPSCDPQFLESGWARLPFNPDGTDGSGHRRYHKLRI